MPYADKAKKAERDRQYNREHSAQRLVANKDWVKRNPDKNRAKAERYRARQLEAEGSFTAADIDALYETQAGRCAYCGCDISDGYHIDHVQPLSRGGSNWPDNLALACVKCNTSKGAKEIDEWKAGD